MINDDVIVVEEVGEKNSIRFIVNADKKIKFYVKCIQNKTDMSTVLNELIDKYLNHQIELEQ